MNFNLSKFLSSLKYIDISDIHAFVIGEISNSTIDYTKESFSEISKKQIEMISKILEKDRTIIDIGNNLKIIESYKASIDKLEKENRLLRNNVSKLQKRLNFIQE